MPANPDGKLIAKKLVSLEVHVKDLIVPSSRESTLSCAKEALAEYKKLIDTFQALVDDANDRDDSSGRRRAAGTAVTPKTQMVNMVNELVPNPADMPGSLTALAVSCPHCGEIGASDPTPTAQPICAEKRLEAANKKREAAFRARLLRDPNARRTKKNGTGSLSMPYVCQGRPNYFLLTFLFFLF